MKVATSRINYKNPEYTCLDITVKSSEGFCRTFAPTWSMVNRSKEGLLSWADYSRQYTDLINLRYAVQREDFKELFKHDKVCLQCYCADSSSTDKHCHRYLMVDIIEKICIANGLPFEYVGELK